MLAEREAKMTYIILTALDFGVDQNQNVTTCDGKRLIYNGKEEVGRFVKYGDGPFNGREMKFDPLNNFQFMNFLFGVFMERYTNENQEAQLYTQDGEPYGPQSITYVRTICFKDDNEKYGIMTRYLSMDTNVGVLESESYIHPTLAFAELMLHFTGVIHALGGDAYLREVDEIKLEMEQRANGSYKRSNKPRITPWK